MHHPLGRHFRKVCKHLYTVYFWHHMMPDKKLIKTDRNVLRGGENPLFTGFCHFFGGPSRAHFVAFCGRILLTLSPAMLQDGDVKGCQSSLD
jgi:hypothetical protein